MNSSLESISTLVKSNVAENCLINFLMNVSSQSLRDYLRLANIYCKSLLQVFQNGSNRLFMDASVKNK